MEQLDSGACRDVDATVFDPLLGDDLAEERAKQYCRRCPVRLGCLALALGMRSLPGIWGGLTAASERVTRRKSKTRRSADARAKRFDGEWPVRHSPVGRPLPRRETMQNCLIGALDFGVDAVQIGVRM